jgi:hypothetical protein
MEQLFNVLTQQSRMMLVRGQTLRSERGQGALEYIAIVVGLVVLIYLGYRLAGQRIRCEAGSFVDSVLGGDGNGAGC